MKRLLTTVVLPLILLAPARSMLNSLLEAQPSDANSSTAFSSTAFLFVSGVASLLSSLLALVPWLALVGVVLCSLVLIFGESPFAKYEPLDTEPPATHDLAAVRSVLRTVREWLLRQHLPAVTGPLAESISSLCEDIDHQLADREPAEITATATTLHKLLTVELAKLVLRYRRVPNAHRLLPWLSASANDMLLNGLRAVDNQLGSVHENLARSDIRELAIQARYLELKSESESGSAASASTRPGSVGSRFDLNQAAATVGHVSVITPPRKNASSREPRSSSSAHPRFIALPTSRDRVRVELDDESNFPFVALGAAAAAVAVAAIEGSHGGSECERSDGGVIGGGGAFGGAGASGDWVPDSEGEGDDEPIAAGSGIELSNVRVDEDVSPSDPEPDAPAEPSVSDAEPDA